MKRELNIVLLMAAAWCAGIILAPMMSGTGVSHILYRCYAAVCHQFASRSFHIDGEPFAVCIRCSAIYGAFFSALIVIRFSETIRTMPFSPVRLLIAAALPITIDGMLSLLSIIGSTTASRIITGTLFGAGLALLLHAVLCEVIHSFFHHHQKTYDLEA